MSHHDLLQQNCKAFAETWCKKNKDLKPLSCSLKKNYNRNFNLCVIHQAETFCQSSAADCSKMFEKKWCNGSYHTYKISQLLNKGFVWGRLTFCIFQKKKHLKTKHTYSKFLNSQTCFEKMFTIPKFIDKRIKMFQFSIFFKFRCKNSSFRQKFRNVENLKVQLLS